MTNKGQPFEDTSVQFAENLTREAMSCIQGGWTSLSLGLYSSLSDKQQAFAQAPPVGTSGEFGFNPRMFGD